MLISIEPGAVDFLPELFSMQANERGRLLALMLLAIIFLLYMQVESRGKYVRLNRQFDRVVRSLSLSSIALDYRDRYKPIMILIPAYNEAENLELLLKKLPSKVSGLDVGCLVVDDGSEDATRDVVERHGFLCVSNLVNRGTFPPLNLAPVNFDAVFQAYMQKRAQEQQAQAPKLDA